MQSLNSPTHLGLTKKLCRRSIALMPAMLLILWHSAPAVPAPAAPPVVPPTAARSTVTQPIPVPYARQYTAFAIQSCDRVEANLPEITRLAEFMAARHLAGGAIGFVGGYYEGSGLHSELEGRSGGLINIGFDRVWTKDRTDAQKANDMAIVAWDNGPWPTDLEKIAELRKNGTYIIGFGARAQPELADRVAACDVWLDTGLGAESRIVPMPAPHSGVRGDSPTRAGRGNLLVNMLNGWCLNAEFVSALTRQGKMPTMWKSYMYPDGREWADLYFLKKQFHDDYQIAPIPAGQLAHTYLKTLRDNITWFAATQLPLVPKAAETIVAESVAGRKITVATSIHAPPTYVGKYEDKAWASSFEVGEADAYIKDTPDNALVLRLGYTGIGQKEMDMFAQKKQRVLFITTPSPREERKIPDGLPFIDMGWVYGDAVVSIEGYPIKILPVSGIMQIIAYESVNVEVLARMALQPAKAGQ